MHMYLLPFLAPPPPQPLHRKCVGVAVAGACAWRLPCEPPAPARASRACGTRRAPSPRRRRARSQKRWISLFSAPSVRSSPVRQSALASTFFLLRTQQVARPAAVVADSRGFPQEASRGFSRVLAISEGHCWFSRVFAGSGPRHPVASALGAWDRSSVRLGAASLLALRAGTGETGGMETGPARSASAFLLLCESRGGRRRLWRGSGPAAARAQKGGPRATPPGVPTLWEFQPSGSRCRIRVLGHSRGTVRRASRPEKVESPLRFRFKVQCSGVKENVCALSIAASDAVGDPTCPGLVGRKRQRSTK